MQVLTRQERQVRELKLLRKDYDYLWQINGQAIPKTKGKLEKFTKQLLSMLDNRLVAANLQRSNAVITNLPTNPEAATDTKTSGIRRVS